MSTMMFDTHKAVRNLKAAGASEDLARAVVQIVCESAVKDAMPRNASFDPTKMGLALGDLEVRITNRFAWISLGVMSVSIFCSLMLSMSLLAS